MSGPGQEQGRTGGDMGFPPVSRRAGTLEKEKESLSQRATALWSARGLGQAAIVVIGYTFVYMYVSKGIDSQYNTQLSAPETGYLCVLEDHRRAGTP